MKHLSHTNQNLNRFENVPTPVQPADAVNKGYVDAGIDGIGSLLDQQKAGQPDTLTSFGDSITYGADSSDPATKAYPVLVGSMKGWTVDNRGVSGARSNDPSVLDAIMSEIVEENRNYTLMIGTNNGRLNGSDLGFLDTFKGCVMYEAAWLAIPDEFKYRASDLPKTGTWATNTSTVVGTGNGMQSSTANSTITARVTGDTVYIGTYATKTSAAIFTVTIDGIEYAGWNGAEHQSLNTRQGSGGDFSAYLLRYPGLTNGPHTVVIRLISGTAFIDWVAGNGYHRESDGPNLWLSNIVRATQAYYDFNPIYSDAVVRLYSAAISDIANSLAQDGLNVCFVDSLSALNNTTDMAGLHPNDSGYQKIAEVFYSEMSSFTKPRDRGGRPTTGTTYVEAQLTSKFSYFGFGYQRPGFYRDSSGIVHVEGSISSTGQALDDVIFTLPPGFRPEASMNFVAVRGTSTCGVRIRSNGQVSQFSGGLTSYLTIDGISFRAMN